MKAVIKVWCFPPLRQMVVICLFLLINKAFLPSSIAQKISLSQEYTLWSSEDVEYTVELGADSIYLHPTHISTISASEATSYSLDYVHSLINILSFDISVNGMMKLLSQHDQAKVEKILIENKAKESLPIAQLQAMSLSYLIVPQLQGKNLHLQVTSFSDGVTKSFSPIPLSGTLSIDRGRIHQLADCIFQEFFDQPGIATTKILYSKRYTSTDSVQQAGKIVQKGVSSTAEIYASDYDGENIKQITFLKSISVTPQWILSSQSTASSILFVSYLIGQPKVYLLSLKDGKLLRLSKMPGNQMTPAVSQDSRKVAFCSDITGSSDLYMVSFEPSIGEINKPRQLYKTLSAATGCPTFSPDGTQVAFVSNKSGSPKIYTLNLPSIHAKLRDLQPTLITKRCRENSSPVWSPDGKKIAYNARTSADRQIWIYDVEHGTEYQLTTGDGAKENPTWAPDSFHLAYQGYYNKKWEIFLIDLNQKKSTRITSGPGDKQFPAWEVRQADNKVVKSG